jgi:ABC-type phosphate transport system substrate-binding protein
MMLPFLAPVDSPTRVADRTKSMYPHRAAHRSTPSKGNEVKNIKAAAICAAVGVAIAGVAIATPAYADPISNSYSLVGSDTLQDVSNALVNGTSISGSFVRSLTSTGTSLGSFDAFGSTTIQTKQGGVYFGRPSGSGDGVKALSRSIDGAPYTAANGVVTPSITGQVDVARSSSGPGSAANASGVLAYVPFGRDAVTYAYNGTSATLGSITTAQLTQIYSCVAGANVINGVTVQPLLPQAGSGTRKFFLGAIGVTDNTALVNCVTNNGANPGFAAVNENDGTALTAVGQIAPFSIASYVAQSNVAAPNRIGSAALGSPIGTAPYTGTGSALVPNSAYYSNSTWGRDTYMVVEFARIDSTNPKFEQPLADLINPAKAKSLTNFSAGPTTSGAVKSKFGFLAPSSTTILRANAS